VETSFDATFFVGLQEIDNDDEVLDAVGLALDLKTPTLGSLLTALAQRRTLFVLDNCEHVLDGVVDVLDHVISHAEECHVLATSREGLALDGEQVIPVPTLGVDDEGPAVALFVERARARGYGLEPTGDLTAITSICARLDGLPLAIELAAARVGVLSPTELLERLDERFRVLTGSRRRRSRDRQRTLEETIDWSYDLLDPDDRVAFARLAVFAGAFDLSGAAAVLHTDEWDALDLLETLVDRSLLGVDDHLTGRRYRYLETIRAYAERRLHDSGASDEVLEVLHRHHVAAMPELAERFREHMRTEAARLELDTPNLRRAFDWAIERQDAPAATALVQPFIAMIGLIVWPIHGWADEVLALPGVTDTVHEPVLRLLQANDRHLDNQFRELKETCLRMLDLDHTPRPLPDEMIISVVLLLTLVGEYQVSEELLQERSAAGLRSWAGPVPEMYLALRNSAPIDHLVAEVGPVGEFGRAMASYYESMRLGREGPNAEVREVQRDALELFVMDSPYWFGTLQLAMSVELAAGNVTDALEMADLDLEHAYRIADRSAMIMPLACYAKALRQLGEVEVAAILRGRLPRRLTVFFEDELVLLDAWLREHLDEQTRRDLAARGKEMEPRELRDLARSMITQPRSRT
jgi:predicted ATPase